MKSIGVILARLDSRRLPLKAFMEVSGRPLISYAVDRALRLPSLSAVIVATSTRPVDDALVEYGRKAGVAVFRGSADNVAERCSECAKEHGADFFVRLNADSPFPDQDLIESGLQLIRRQGAPDLVTNLIGRTFPYGISVEIVNVATMGRILPTLDADEAEHVTKRFYDRPAEFLIRQLVSPKPELRPARLAVDTAEDLAILGAIVQRLGPRVLEARYDEVATLYMSESKVPSSIESAGFARP